MDAVDTSLVDRTDLIRDGLDALTLAQVALALDDRACLEAARARASAVAHDLLVHCREIARRRYVEPTAPDALALVAVGPLARALSESAGIILAASSPAELDLVASSEELRDALSPLARTVLARSGLHL